MCQGDRAGIPIPLAVVVLLSVLVTASWNARGDDELGGEQRVFFISAPAKTTLGDELRISVGSRRVVNVSVAVYAGREEQSRFMQDITVRGRKVVAVPPTVINATGVWRVEVSDDATLLRQSISVVSAATTTVDAEIRDYRQQHHTLLSQLFETLYTHRNLISLFLLVLSGLAYVYSRTRR